METVLIVNINKTGHQLSQNMDRSENRHAMMRIMGQAKFKQIYIERAYRVEPMQGLVKEIFDLDRCWMKVRVWLSRSVFQGHIHFCFGAHF
jgi:hypothetical protein